MLAVGPRTVTTSAIPYVRDAFCAARGFADLDDLNAQAEAWCAGPAADRRCPDAPERSVGEAFAEEAGCLMALPGNPAPLLERVAGSVGKTPYVRFDLNDHSVPHGHVRRMLTVLADPHEVRIVDGAELLARHRRRYDKGAQIEDAAHLQALVDDKRPAHQRRATDRLAQAVPASQALLARAADLHAAVLEALERGVPHPNAVRLALGPRRGQHGDAPPVVLVLPAHVQARDAPVRPHALRQPRTRAGGRRHTMRRRPSCCSTKTAILSSRPALAQAVEHSGILTADGRRCPRRQHSQAPRNSTPKRCHTIGSHRSGKRRAVYARILAAANNEHLSGASAK